MGLKISGMLIVGLVVAAVIYPIIHELGHLLTAEMMGAESIDIHWGEQSHYICSLPSCKMQTVPVISLGGYALPTALAALPVHKGFFMWYANFMMKIVCIWAAILSILTVVQTTIGSANTNNDISLILQIEPAQQAWLFLFFAAVIILLISQLLQTHPLAKICDYLM